jgi:4'-phosphopantetheinyl transferase EntD
VAGSTQVRSISELAEPFDAGLFSRLFPASVGAAAAWVSGEILPLFPEEAKAVGNAVEKRRSEFAAGRNCARLALAQLDHPPCAIPRGPDRAPVWPAGFVGSITHSIDFCAAVVAESHRFRSIGIDSEPIGAISEELADQVLRPDEAADPHLRFDGADWPTLHFCLKEAAFKAFYPVRRRIIGFHDMRLRVDAGARAFVAEAPAPLVLEGRYDVRYGHIHAVCWCR